jgi:hypothetical protein
MAIILEFPRELAPRRRVVAAEADMRGEILLFTGVRYERWSDGDEPVVADFEEPDGERCDATAEAPQGH